MGKCLYTIYALIVLFEDRHNEKNQNNNSTQDRRCGDNDFDRENEIELDDNSCQIKVKTFEVADCEVFPFNAPRNVAMSKEKHNERDREKTTTKSKQISEKSKFENKIKLCLCAVLCCVVLRDKTKIKFAATHKFGLFFAVCRNLFYLLETDFNREHSHTHTHKHRRPIAPQL